MTAFEGWLATHLPAPETIDPQPGCLRRRLHLLERPRVPLPFKPAEAPPTTTLNAKQQQALATALLHADRAKFS